MSQSYTLQSLIAWTFFYYLSARSTVCLIQSSYQNIQRVTHSKPPHPSLYRNLASTTKSTTFDNLTSLKKLVIKYLELKSATVPEVSTLNLLFTQEQSRSLVDSSEDRRSRLATASTKPRKIIATKNLYLRNAYVVAEVLLRPIGACEGCESAASFSGDQRE